MWGTYESDVEREIDCDATMVTESMNTWRAPRRKTDKALALHPTLDERCDGNGYSVRRNLAKLIHECARHTGDADLIREDADLIRERLDPVRCDEHLRAVDAMAIGTKRGSQRNGSSS